MMTFVFFLESKIIKSFQDTFMIRNLIDYPKYNIKKTNLTFKINPSVVSILKD
jgi:hypothetical protein